MEQHPGTATPYASLEDLRDANDKLLEKLPDGDQPDAKLPTAEINEFIRRAVETGSLLDTSAARRAAQGLIDYLCSNFPSIVAREGKSIMSGRSDMILKSFDEKPIAAASEKGDAIIAVLGERDKELVRRILMNCLELWEGTETIVPTRATLEKLENLGDPGRVRLLVGQLADAGVLIHEDNGSIVRLQYEALTRQWPQLSEWVRQRIKLRNDALLWERGGKRTEALLSSGLWREAENSGSLTDTEIRFVAASRSRGRHLKMALAATALIVFLIPAGAGLIWNHRYQQQVLEERRAELQRREDERKALAQEIETAQTLLNSADASGEARVKALRFLLDNKEASRFLSDSKKADDDFVKFQALTLEDAEFSDVRSTGVQFSQSTFRQVGFSNASLPLAGFTQTTLTDVKFVESDLTRARFDDAVLKKTTFSRTHLRQSTFDRVLFCGEVTFLVSNLRDASFRNVTFGEVPKFVGTAWWLAVGWSIDDVRMLAKQSEGVDYASTEAYVTELERRDKRVSEANSNVERAEALNSKAWHQAIHGVNLADAEQASRESIKLMKAHIAQPSSSPLGTRFADLKPDDLTLLEGHYLDTLAYILMQKKEYGEALRLLKEASEKSRGHKEIQFHYALVLFATENKQEAKAVLSASIEVNKYVPSHELYLLMAIVEKREFREWLEAMLTKDEKAINRPKRECN